MKKNEISNQRFHSREVFPSVVQRLLSSCNTKKCFQHLESSPLPSRNSIAQALHRTRCILFPGYFTQNALAASNLEYCLHEEIKTLYKELSNLIIIADQHDCLRYDKPCAACEETGYEKALAFIRALPELREILATDVRANLQAALKSTCDRLDLVTREELEIQEAVLARTRAKLDQLEGQVRELERARDSS